MALTLQTDVPDDSTRARIVALARRIEQEDGAPPLSDQALTQLHSTAAGHVVVRDGDEVTGYAQRSGDGLEIAAAPGAVEAVLDAVLDGAPRPLLVWSHGARSRLVATFEGRGFERARELYQLRRPSSVPLPAQQPPADGVRIRAFEPGRDDAGWLRVNAAAFAHHPEQGRWTQADLDAREAEAWFDPAGFLVAERDDRLIGFHWTKVHPDGLGEVYVLGVDPDTQGLGLGRTLLVAGLHLLVGRGCPAVLLYVDGDNTPALRLYEKYGFGAYETDIQWRIG